MTLMNWISIGITAALVAAYIVLKIYAKLKPNNTTGWVGLLPGAGQRQIPPNLSKKRPKTTLKNKTHRSSSQYGYRSYKSITQKRNSSAIIQTVRKTHTLRVCAGYSPLESPGFQNVRLE